MNSRRKVLCTLLVGIASLAPLRGQPPSGKANRSATTNLAQQSSGEALVTAKASASPQEAAASPQMERLAKALAGDWNTVETMERGEFFPHGGSRRGVVQARLAAGGNTLIYDIHSDGDAGQLDGFLTIWWDKEAKLYHFFACFNNPEHPCSNRGSAHWEGDRLVNNYFEIVKGKKTRWQDSFSFTPITHTLVAAEDTGHGKMKSVITTRATRQ